MSYLSEDDSRVLSFAVKAVKISMTLKIFIIDSFKSESSSFCFLLRISIQRNLLTSEKTLVCDLTVLLTISICKKHLIFNDFFVDELFKLITVNLNSKLITVFFSADDVTISWELINLNLWVSAFCIKDCF